MPDERKPESPVLDELDDYLSGASPLSRQYRREFAPMPPHALDRHVLKSARQTQPKSQYLAPLAFAASVLLSVALVLAIVFGPQAAKKLDDVPHLMRVRSVQPTAARTAEPRTAEPRTAAPRVSADVRERTPAAWLNSIEALRRAGRSDEADAEMRLFRRIYPDYATTTKK